MAETRVPISQLPVLAEISNSDIVAIVSGGVTYRMTVANFLAAVNEDLDKLSERISNISINGGGSSSSGSGLPSVSTADNGKVLMVVGGSWAAASLTNLEGVLF